MKERVAVLGGTGFIGSHLCQKLVEDGHRVTCFTRRPDSPNIKDLQGTPGFEVFVGDVLNLDAVKSAIQGHDQIIFAAGITSVDQALRDPKGSTETNVLGLLNVLEAMRMQGSKSQKISLASTDMVYGVHLREAGVTERMQTKPTTNYAATKAMQTMMAIGYWNQFGVKTTIFELSNIYGPKQDTSKFIPRQIMLALDGYLLSIYGDGKQQREWVYVNDVINAIKIIMLHGQPGERYLVGPGAVRRNIEVAKSILFHLDLDDSRLDFVPSPRTGDVKFTIGDSKKLDRLGWKVLYAFEDGLRSTIDWYQAHKDEVLFVNKPNSKARQQVEKVVFSAS